MTENIGLSEHRDYTSALNWLKKDQKQHRELTIRWLQIWQASVSAAFQLQWYPNCWAIKHWSKNGSYVCSSHKTVSFSTKNWCIYLQKECGTHRRIFGICLSVNSHACFNKRSVTAYMSQHPCRLRDVSKVEGMLSEWCSSTVTFQLDLSETSIFPSQGAPWSNSQTGSLAQWCHQTADHGPEREQEGDSWHCSGCCAVWHSGLADLWGWGDSALALGLHEEKFLAVFPLLTPSKNWGHEMLVVALTCNITTRAVGCYHDFSDNIITWIQHQVNAHHDS